MTKTFHDFLRRDSHFQDSQVTFKKCVNLLKRTVKDCPTKAGKKYIFCNLLWSKYMSKEFFIKFTLRRINKVPFVLVVDNKTKDCNINKLQLCFDCDSSHTPL